MNGRARIVCVRPLAAALLLWLAQAAGAAAQITVTPQSELRFGTLTAGIPTSIQPAAVGSARIDVTGRGQVTIVVNLPATLSSPTGAQVPVQYSATDGQYRIGNRPVQTFDPRSPFTVSLPNPNQPLRVWVGGTAVPAATQRAGAYSGTITLQVFP